MRFVAHDCVHITWKFVFTAPVALQPQADHRESKLAVEPREGLRLAFCSWKKRRTNNLRMLLMSSVSGWPFFPIRNIPNQHFPPAWSDCKSRYVHHGCWKPPMLFHENEKKMEGKKNIQNKAIKLYWKNATRSRHIFTSFSTEKWRRRWSSWVKSLQKVELKPLTRYCCKNPQISILNQGKLHTSCWWLGHGKLWSYVMSHLLCWKQM